MVPYVVYDLDGHVLMVGRAPSVNVALMQGSLVLPGVLGDLENYYVTDGVTVVTDDDDTMVAFDKVLRARPTLPRFGRVAIAADGVDAATLAGLPEGATVSVDGGEPQPADGEVAVVSTMPASYRLVVSCWPYLDYAETIVAA